MQGTLTAGRYGRMWVVALIAVAVFFALCLMVGPGDPVRGKVSLSLGWPGLGAILDERLMRVSCAALVGFALAGAGVTLQALLRNPLADPYVLGISSGASVGVMGWMLVTGPLMASMASSEMTLRWLSMGKTLPAVVGAIGACVVVFAVARRRGGAGGGMDPVTLLLVGVVVSAMNGALLMLMNSLVPGNVRVDFMSYVMGSIGGGVDKPLLKVAAMVIALGYVPMLWAGRALNVGSLSEVEAVSLGVNVGRLRTLSFVAASVLTAGAITLSGPIGFVGLICPHICRGIVGADHRKLLVVGPCVGAVFLMAADTLVRGFPIFNGELPVGVVTAFCGGPFFLVLLRKRRGADE